MVIIMDTEVDSASTQPVTRSEAVRVAYLLVSTDNAPCSAWQSDLPESLMLALVVSSFCAASRALLLGFHLASTGPAKA